MTPTPTWDHNFSSGHQFGTLYLKRLDLRRLSLWLFTVKESEVVAAFLPKPITVADGHPNFIYLFSLHASKL